VTSAGFKNCKKVLVTYSAAAAAAAGGGLSLTLASMAAAVG
jgi:hypothetical protein